MRKQSLFAFNCAAKYCINEYCSAWNPDPWKSNLTTQTSRDYCNFADGEILVAEIGQSANSNTTKARIQLNDKKVVIFLVVCEKKII